MSICEIKNNALVQLSYKCKKTVNKKKKNKKPIVVK